MGIRIKIIAFLIFAFFYGLCWYKGIETKLENRGCYLEQC